jgi:maleamate amidohydrolase
MGGIGAMADKFNTYHQIGYSSRKIGFGKRPAIVVVDFQRAFLDEQFPLGRSSRLRQSAEHTEQLLQVGRSNDVPIIHTVVAYRDKWDLGNWKMAIDWIKENSQAAEVSPLLKPQPNEPVLIKKAPSAFFGTELISLLTLNGIDTVIVTGCVTSGCVRATIVDSFSYGFKTVVPEECVGDYTKEQHNSNLFDVNNRYADVLPKSEVMSYLNSLVTT